MLTLDLTTDLALTDGTYRVTGSSGSLLRLQNLATGSTTSEHLADITGRLIEAPAWPTTAPRDLDHLDPHDLKEVQFWAIHIEEMTSGIRPGHDTPRPEYDPATTSQNERVAAKVLELNAQDRPASRAALFRKKGLYETGGTAALIDQRKLRTIGKLDLADSRVIDAISDVASEYTNKSTVTQTFLHTRVAAHLIRKYGSDAPDLPARATLYRYFEALTKGRFTTGKATTRRSKANIPDRTLGTRRRLLPGEEVQVDSTPMDILVRVPGAKEPMRPILTIMLDVATRSIIAFTIRLEAAKGYDHALLLTQALVPHQNRPDRTDHRALIAAYNPSFAFLSPADRAQAEATRPFIFPRRIMSDNGKDYLSDVFLSACKKYGIDITHSAIHTPTDKGAVERTFQTINTLFTQTLPGYVGNHNVNRGTDLDTHRLLDIAALTELLDDWILTVYQNRPHRGLRDPMEPAVTYSPNQAYAGAIAHSGAIAIPLTRDDFIDLLPRDYRVIGATGVQFKNRHFDSDALHPLRFRPSNNPRRKGRWEVRFNPYDYMHVWVRSRDKTWIECAWREIDVLHSPNFAAIVTATRDARRADIARTDAYLAGTAMPTGEPVHVPAAEPLPAFEDPDTDTDTDALPLPPELDLLDLGEFSFED